MDEIQARAMEYSIYFLLVLIYSLMGIIGFKVWRIMAIEERALVSPKSADRLLELPSEPASANACQPAMVELTNDPSKFQS
jgi:hypothetical protein